ncbi:Protein S100-A1 [Liparis tanakae]|uniref:Protein S100 n=1 Tax=Liparis tanakae TaxID=230148 RepID=A0A4Z2HVS2_9TELE|nr:Protein S100-A1 [Liparis tanakae]
MPDTIMSKEPTSNLESAMQMLIKTFHKYSGKEGDKFTLSRGELKELLLEELGTYLGGSSKDNEAVEKVMNDLDANNDGEVDFTEFIILMGALTVACNDFFLDCKTDEKPDESKGESAPNGNEKLIPGRHLIGLFEYLSWRCSARR